MDSTAERNHLASDPELAAAARQGDEQAFTALYRRHGPIAWRTGLAITGDPAEAAPVVADAFARAFTALRAGRCAPDTAFRALLLTSVRNAVLDRRRDQHRSPDDAARFTYVTGDEAELVAAAFAPLPERWRSALWLRDVEGLRSGQVAPVIGLAPTGAATLAARARKGLGEQYLRACAARAEHRNCARSIARLGAYVTGSLPASDATKLERHLDLCDACRERREGLAEVGARLGLLSLPLPTSLAGDTRTAWAAAVAVDRSVTGLPVAAERVLAGVSAFAAAVGVLGATMFGTGGSGDDRAAAVTPAVSDSSDEGPIARATPLDLPAPDPVSATTGTSSSGTSTSATSDSSSRRSAQGTDHGTGGDDGIVGASNPGTEATRAGDIAEGDSSDPAPPDTTTDVPVGNDPQPAEAPAKVGTTVGDTPIAVEIDEEPGISVGPVSLGSEPEPDDDIVAVDGALEPLAPVVEPVVDAVDETLDGVTGGLGL